MKAGCIHILLSLLLPFFPVWSQQKKIILDPSVHSIQYKAIGHDSLFILPHRFIIKGTVCVRIDSITLKEGIAYLVNDRKGEVRFILPPDSGSTLNIAYKHLPIRLPLEYYHWQITDSFDIPQGKQQTVKQEGISKSEFDSDALTKSGSIFRGISIGTDQGMQLQSGLRLQVSGKITPKVDIIASLTDQSTPIQPEGNTQSLQEIDKVFVNVKAPGLQVTMGDFSYDVKGSEFGTYSRKLQGATGTAETSFGSLRLIAAASKGNFTSNHFQGQEGKQGPYQLTGSLGQREIIVLAGTESVWIDGDRLTRGEENDYTIEYGNGQILFMRKRLITGDSRITVDFEYSDQKFQKEIYGAVMDGRFLKDRLKIHTSFLRESDDKENPLDAVLTDNQKQVLEMAGDNPDSAVVSGAVLVGENAGNYQRVDSSDVIYYVYVGTNQGDYKVQFSYVGSGKGDYSFQGYGIYRYEGSGQGSYLPILYLPMAVSHQVANIASSFIIAKGVSIEGEIGISDRDLNRYSALDDGDNIDFAYWSTFRIDSLRLRLFGTGLGDMGILGNIRSVGDKFRSLGRITEIEHGRKWGVEEGSYWGEEIQEVRGFYKPMSNWLWGGELGFFRKGDGFESKRKSLISQLNQPKIPRMNYQIELIETIDRTGETGYWLRQQGNVGVEWKWFRPSVSYMGEHRKKEAPDTVRTGFRFDEWASSIQIKTDFIKGEWRETIRDDRQYVVDVLQKNSLARTDQFQCDLRLGKGFSSSILYTHRDRDYADKDVEDQKSDLADVKIKIVTGRQFFDGSLNYRFSSTQVSEMVKDTIHVGEGLGNYRFDEDLNELVPDPDGDIILRTIQTGDFLPVNDLRMGSEIRLDGSRLWNDKKGVLGFLGNICSRSLIRVERRDQKRQFSAVNRSAFQPDWGNDSTTIMGLISFHQDLEYTESKSKFAVRLRFRKDDSENHQFIQEGLIHHIKERSIRMKGNPAKRFGILLEYKNNQDHKIYTESTLSSRTIQSDEWIAEASYRPEQKIELALKARATWSQDIYPDPATEAASFFIVPRFGYSLKSRGHLRAELEFGEVRSNPSDRTLPYEMLKGDQPGRTFRWTILMTYRISGHVMATLNYRGRQEPWRERLYQTGQVEIRAFF